jgi:hypothetical protein
MPTHSITVEALEWLLFLGFESKSLKPEDALDREGKSAIDDLLQCPTIENTTQIIANASYLNLNQRYKEFKNDIRHGQYGRTVQFLITYMERVWLVPRFWRATKERDLDLHISSLVEKCYSCFEYDLQNYARYTTIYVMLLLIMDETHPGLIILFV